MAPLGDGRGRLVPLLEHDRDEAALEEMGSGREALGSGADDGNGKVGHDAPQIQERRYEGDPR
jgi:hypothetical protein